MSTMELDRPSASVHRSHPDDDGDVPRPPRLARRWAHVRAVRRSLLDLVGLPLWARARRLPPCPPAPRRRACSTRACTMCATCVPVCPSVRSSASVLVARAVFFCFCVSICDGDRSVFFFVVIILTETIHASCERERERDRRCPCSFDLVLALNERQWSPSALTRVFILIFPESLWRCVYVLIFQTLFLSLPPSLSFDLFLYRAFGNYTRTRRITATKYKHATDRQIQSQSIRQCATTSSSSICLQI